MENSNFISDSELNGYINSSYAELYDILVTTFADYYITNSELTISSGNDIPVPSDFYKLRGVDYQLSTNEWINLYKFNFERRNSKNRDTIRTYRGEPTRQYRLLGSNITIEPEDQATGTYRVWYVPNYTKLSDDTDTVDGVNGWEEYIVIDAAIKMALKEESDIQGLLIQKGAILKRITDASNERDVGEPETIADTQTDLYYDDALWNRY
tara:strand:- start:486 stop:1115 length:630 start_codon:yes stop_codon:yes gene_type:complete